MTFDSHQDASHLYFITAALCGWKPLFIEPTYANIVLNSLDWLRRQGRMGLYAFVLMPSHLHAIVKPTKRTIGELLQNFGSYTAHVILKQLRRENRTDLLEFFHQSRRDSRHQHSIWQDIQAKNVYSSEFLRQKLEYIHNNPVDKDWSLVDDRVDYTYSSARFYDCDEPAVIQVDDVSQYF
jgi:REP element-mobilizing transposase RayT